MLVIKYLKGAENVKLRPVDWVICCIAPVVATAALALLPMIVAFRHCHS